MKSLVIAVLVLLTSISFAGDGAHGGGLGEKNLVFAFFSLEQNISDCLNSTICRMDNNETQLLRKILETLNSKRETISQLVFKSEKAEPGFFVLFGQVKSAKTGSAIGSKIYINTDHLYRLNATGFTSPITVMEGVTLLVHELSHHHGVGDESEELRKIDILCAKLVRFIENYGLGAFRNTESSVLGINRDPQLLMSCVPFLPNTPIMRIWVQGIPMSYLITAEAAQGDYAFPPPSQILFKEENLIVGHGDPYFEINPNPRVNNQGLVSFQGTGQNPFRFTVNLLDPVSRSSISDFRGYSEIGGEIKNYRCDFASKGKELASDTRWMFFLR